jgi:hypothetical protein
MVAGSGTQLSSLDTATTNVAPPAGVSFPYGALSFRATTAPGGLAEVTLRFPGPVTQWYKLVGGAWVPFTEDAASGTGSTAAGSTITIRIRDNGRGDADPTPGVVVDPGAAGLPTPNAVVRLSTSADRSASRPLDGSTVSGPVAIFIAPEPGIRRVEFLLDGELEHTERYAPYDFGGTARNGRAKLWSSRTAPDGTHVIEVRIVTTTGTRTERATFTVSNPRPAERRILVSTSADRRSPVALDGATVPNAVAVFVPREPGLASVDFALDGQFVRTERFAPYDLGSTRPNGTARMLELSPGQHTVTVRMRFTDGFVDELVATFTRE